MIIALQTFVDNGLSNEALQILLNSIISGDSFEDDSDKRCCIAMLFDYEQGNKDDPDRYSIGYDNNVDGPRGEYLILDDKEADTAVAKYIENSVWAFRSSFLSSETGIDESVFEALINEESNDAILSIIKGTCGIDSFVENAVSADGRGHFLAYHDNEEYELSVDGAEYYIYQMN